MIKNIISLLIISTILYTPYIWSLTPLTLTDLQAYAHSHPEFPQSDDNDWLDPDYSSFHESLKPGLLTRLLRTLNLIAKPVLTPEYFVELINNVKQQRTAMEFVPGQKNTSRIPKNMIAKITGKQPIHFVIWGDLHGAFHSLVRALSWLHQEHIINEQLKIIKPDYYFVFNGDAINRSPYTLETLTVLLLLLQENTDHVLYIRGKHEDKNYWRNFSLKRELLVRLSPQQVPRIEKVISAFFNTLPLALYVNSIQDKTSFIRISHSDRSSQQIQEKNIAHCLVNNTNPQLTYCPIDRSKISSTYITIPAIIKTENWMKENRTQTGLGLLDQDHGSTAWAILSSPTGVHKEYYGFNYDAFALVDITVPIANSTITLCNRDIRTNEPFKKNEPYNLVSSMPARLTPNNPKPLTFGSSLSLVQGIPVMGHMIQRGIFVDVNEVNLAGGIHNNYIKVIVYNDNYTPYIARENINRLLLKDHTDIIVLPTGNITLNAYLDYVRTKSVLVLFPITGNSKFRSSDLSGIINFRASYADEVNVLIDHLINKYNVHKFAFFYQDDVYGTGPLEDAHNALKRNGINQWTDIPYTNANVNFKEQVNTIKRIEPDTIGFFANAHAIQELLRQLGIEYVINKQLFGVSFAGAESLRRYLERVGITITFGAVVPNPRTSQLPIAQEYRSIMSRNGYSYDTFSFEAYITTNLLIEAIKKIHGPITKDALINVFESLHDYNFRGLMLSFNPKQRSLARSVWIETSPHQEWIEKKLP